MAKDNNTKLPQFNFNTMAEDFKLGYKSLTQIEGQYGGKYPIIEYIINNDHCLEALMKSIQTLGLSTAKILSQMALEITKFPELYYVVNDSTAMAMVMRSLARVFPQDISPSNGLTKADSIYLAFTYLAE